MVERTSRFVLEVLPYVLSALRRAWIPLFAGAGNEGGGRGKRRWSR